MPVSKYMSRACVYRQLSSFRAPTLWFIDLTLATCHIQSTCLSLCQLDKTPSPPFSYDENGRRRLVGAQSIKTSCPRRRFALQLFRSRPPLLCSSWWVNPQWSPFKTRPLVSVFTSPCPYLAFLMEWRRQGFHESFSHFLQFVTILKFLPCSFFLSSSIYGIDPEKVLDW